MRSEGRGSVPWAGKRILFWDDEACGPLQPLLDALGGLFRGHVRGQPRDHVRPDIPWDDRTQLSRALAIRPPAGTIGGDVLMSYLGWASCRMCGRQLGTRDLFGHGFVWPEGAQHYVLDHQVWTPDCDEMLAVVRRSLRVRGPGDR